MAYQLLYWPGPFRGNFIRLTLVIAGVPLQEPDPDTLVQWINQPPEEQTLPTMAPPFLTETKTSHSYGQMPVIALHLAEKHDLLPKNDYKQKLCLKMILDANDILLEITCHHGMLMWEKTDWQKFRNHRLANWMQIFEQTYLKFGKPDSDWFFGKTLTQADIIVYGLWGTMTTRLPQLRVDLVEHAPNITALVDRFAARPEIAEFERQQFEDYGDIYCGGEIENSLRKMLD